MKLFIFLESPKKVFVFCTCGLDANYLIFIDRSP